MWDKKHKAAEFKVEPGCMSIGAFCLRSVRIPAISKEVLGQIQHEFKIQRDWKRKGQFYFSPATDLSLFLALAQRDEIKKHWTSLLDKYLHHRDCHYLWRDSSNRIRHSLKVIKPTVDNWEFSSDRSEWSLWIPSQDIEIHDGYMVVSFNNVRFSACRVNGGFYEDEWKPDWNEFKEHIENKMRVPVSRLIEENLKSSFSKNINHVLNKISKHEPMLFTTYLSKKNTGLLFEHNFLRMGYSVDFNPIWSIQDALLQHYEYSPFGGLDSNYSQMFLVESGETEVATLEEVVTILKRNVHLLKENPYWMNPILGQDFNQKPIEDILNIECIKKRPFCSSFSVVPEYYRERSSDDVLLWYLQNCYKAYTFHEDVSHFSDDYSWGYQNSGLFKSYLILIKGEHKIDEEYGFDASTPSRVLIDPSNKKYSRYSFSVDTSICSLEAAAFIIRCYFSSSMCNKRQGFVIPDIFKAFGVYSFHRE